MNAAGEPGRRHGVLRALGIGMLAPLALVVGCVLPVRAEPVDAEWTAQSPARARMAAAQIPPISLARTCSFKPGILGVGARVEVYWRLPAGYQVSDVQVEASTKGLGSVLAPITGFSTANNTERGSDGVYTTTVRSNLLGGLLGLGSELELAFFVKDASGWTSQTRSVATNAGLLAGIGGTCRNLD